MDHKVFSVCMDLLSKQASDEQGQEQGSHPFWPAAKSVLRGALGVGAGTFAGYAAGEGLSRAHQNLSGKPIPQDSLKKILPVIGAAAGLAYSEYKRRQQEEIDHAVRGTATPPTVP